MQTVNKPNLSKRARYYQSIIDVDHLLSGMNYNDLKDTYIIFICLDDIFGKGLPVYSFQNICTEDGKTKLDDRAFKVFFNASDCDKLKTDGERNFFRSLKGSPATDSLTRRIEEKVRRAKLNAGFRREFMTWEQTIADERYWAKKEGIQQGMEQGAKEKAIETAKNLLKEGIPVETVARCCSLSMEEVLHLAEGINASVSTGHQP